MADRKKVRMSRIPCARRSGSLLLAIATAVLLVLLASSMVLLGDCTRAQYGPAAEKRVAAPAAPEMPRKYYDTTFIAPTGVAINVNSGDDLQSKIDGASLGDTLLLEAGATFTDNIVLPQKSGTEYMVIRTSTPDANLPQSVRVTPSDSGKLAKIVGHVSFDDSAHNYRLIGLEITHPDSDSPNEIVQIGAGYDNLALQPHHNIVDRCYVHGTPTSDVKNGISLNGAETAIINTWIGDIHAVYPRSTYESHAISAAWGTGPYNLTNNHIESSYIGMLVGGTGPITNGVFPEDFEIRNNHFYKPLKWKYDDASWDGNNWGVKNLFELKYGRRVLFDGNLLENNWPIPTSQYEIAGGAQHGWAILFTLRADGDSSRVIDDVTVINNVFRNINCGMQMFNDGGAGLHRILVRNNLFYDMGQPFGNNDRTGRFADVRTGTADINFDHNTILRNDDQNIIMGDDTLTNFAFTNNIVAPNAWGFQGVDTSGMQKNVFQGGNSGDYPPGNFFPAAVANIKFEDSVNDNYRLANDSIYKNAGTDGKDCGFLYDEQVLVPENGLLMPAVACAATALVCTLLVRRRRRE